METIITNSPEDAAEFIKRGGIVAFPTETVYGLGADVFDEAAIKRIFEAKRRPGDNPLIAHVGALEQIGELATEITETAKKFIDVFFPGPLTVVLTKAADVPMVATAGLDTVGVRMPGNQLAREFLRSCGTAVAAPSANISGRPSPTTWQAVYEDLNGRIDCILRGEPTEIGLESTVVDCTGDVPIVLRSGSVTIEQLRAVVPETRVYQMSETEAPRSPGLRHRHYSPLAKVILVTLDKETQSLPLPALTSKAAFIGLGSVRETYMQKRICINIAEYAHAVYEFFRECDRAGVETIYCESVDEAGIGAALMDRIRRAAAG